MNKSIKPNHVLFHTTLKLHHQVQTNPSTSTPQQKYPLRIKNLTTHPLPLVKKESGQHNTNTNTKHKTHILCSQSHFQIFLPLHPFSNPDSTNGKSSITQSLYSIPPPLFNSHLFPSSYSIRSVCDLSICRNLNSNPKLDALYLNVTNPITGFCLISPEEGN